MHTESLIRIEPDRFQQMFDSLLVPFESVAKDGKQVFTVTRLNFRLSGKIPCKSPMDCNWRTSP